MHDYRHSRIHLNIDNSDGFSSKTTATHTRPHCGSARPRLSPAAPGPRSSTSTSYRSSRPTSYRNPCSRERTRHDDPQLLILFRITMLHRHSLRQQRLLDKCTFGDAATFSGRIPHLADEPHSSLAHVATLLHGERDKPERCMIRHALPEAVPLPGLRTLRRHPHHTWRGNHVRGRRRAHA